MRYTQQGIETAEARLRDIRSDVRAFRTRYQTIDPEADAENQIGVVAVLHKQLATSLFELQTIDRNSLGNDPRLPNIECRIEAISAQIAAEEQARIDTNRRSRYLAVRIPPTVAEDSLYPDGRLLFFLVFGACLAGWSMMEMLRCTVRDRR